MTGLEIVGIILLLLGFTFIGIEMFIPGFGFFGITGIISLIAGIVLVANDFRSGIIMAIIAIIVIVLMLFIAMTILKSNRMRKTPIVLDNEMKDGFLSSSDLEYLVGKEGIAGTDLKPSGKGVFDGVTFDILSEGTYIESGEKIVITKVTGNKLMVTEK